MMSTEPLLHATQLSCVRQEKIIFDNLSFELNEGELLLVEGENGSGKSSLLRLLTGLATPASGEIFWGGKLITSGYREALHYVGHANGIKLGLTVKENCDLVLPLQSGVSVRCLTAAAQFAVTPLAILSALKLNPNRLAKSLSAGQKRKLALARLFLLPKKLWILDEPLTALDADTQVFFLSELEKHIDNGGMVIMSSHVGMQANIKNIKKLRMNDV